MKSSKGRQLPYAYPSNSFRDYQQMANLPGVPFHGLRHSFAVMCRLAGIDVIDLRDIMRHRSTKETERYAQISRGMLTDKVQKAFQEAETEPFAPILPHDQN